MRIHVVFDELRCPDCGTVTPATDGAPDLHLASCGRLCWNGCMDTIARVMARIGRDRPGDRDLLHTPACPICASRARQSL